MTDYAHHSPDSCLVTKWQSRALHPADMQDPACPSPDTSSPTASVSNLGYARICKKSGYARNASQCPTGIRDRQ
ncbi:hypothetical protein SKAU_G00144670 [Synaphobranchus kaupii]|uniref:Uncharacterized protein n=1 Tax=Synaphobranchus kaupii TaxID=118154 RepID=A0A9Q1FSU7_SYNKA|nr:hypothetical protein SKAU_G00144670 [Synaphobranchus kaupii]